MDLHILLQGQDDLRGFGLLQCWQCVRDIDLTVVAGMAMTLTVLDVYGFFGEHMDHTAQFRFAVPFRFATSGLGGGALDDHVGTIGGDFSPFETEGACYRVTRVVASLGQGDEGKNESEERKGMHWTSNVGKE